MLWPYRAEKRGFLDRVVLRSLAHMNMLCPIEADGRAHARLEQNEAEIILITNHPKFKYYYLIFF
jgi:hypothetical protein